MDEQVFLCRCGGADHVLRITLFKDDGDAYAEIGPGPNMPFLHRLRHGLAYIFRGEHYCLTDLYLREEDLGQLETFLHRWRNVVENRKVGIPYKMARHRIRERVGSILANIEHMLAHRESQALSEDETKRLIEHLHELLRGIIGDGDA